MVATATSARLTKKNDPMLGFVPFEMYHILKLRLIPFHLSYAKRLAMGPCHAAPEPQSLDLDLLDRELHVAPAVTALLFRKVIESGACTRLSVASSNGKDDHARSRD